VTNTTSPDNTSIEPTLVLSLNETLDKLDEYDAKYDTSWRNESVPDGMISVKAIDPLTRELVLLRNRLKGEKLSLNLIDARTNMLKTQAAVYLMNMLGEQGTVDMKREGQNWAVTENINCDEVDAIASGTKLHEQAFDSWLAFVNNLDIVLQMAPEMQGKIGTNENRPQFYAPVFADSRAQILAVAAALKDQCDVDYPLGSKYVDKPSM